jgi:hypothetical protein
LNFQYRTQGAAAAVYGFTGGSFERAILNPILISYLENLGLIILLVNFLMLTPFVFTADVSSYSHNTAPTGTH